MNSTAESPRRFFAIDYGREAEEEITHLIGMIANTPAVGSMFPARWLAI